MTTFPLGTDTAWTILTLAVVSLAALAAPLVVWRGKPPHPARASVVGQRLAGPIAEATRGALWSAIVMSLGLLTIPSGGEVRLIRLGVFVAAVVAGIGLAWRGLALVSRVFADADPNGPGDHRASPLIGASGAAVAGIAAAILVWTTRQDAGDYLVTAALGLGLVGLSVRAATALAQISGAASTFGVGVLEQEQPPGSANDPGIELTLTASGLASGPRRALDTSALTAFITGAIIMLGVPLMGTAAIITALVFAVAFVLAHLLPLVLPSTGENAQRMRAISAALSGAIPAIGMAAALGLWLPSDYSKLRMSQVGLGSFTDPLLISLFVDPNAQQLPPSVPRDEVEPHIAQLAEKFGEFYQNVGDAPAAQSVADTIALHSISPSFVSVLPVGLGTLLALVIAGALGWVLPRRGWNHVRAASVSPASVGVSGLAVAAPLALLAAVGLAVAVVLTIVASGISYLALYLGLLVAAAVAVVGAGYQALSPVRVGAVDQFDILTGLSDAPANEGRVESAPGAGVSPAPALLLFAAAVAAATFVGPIGGFVRSAPKAESLWADRALRVLFLDSPTVLSGLALGGAAWLACTALVAEPVRRVLSTVASASRAPFADPKRSGAPRADYPELGSDARKTSALVLAVAALGPVIAGFGIGAAAVPAYAVGALLASAAFSVVAGIGGDASTRSSRTMGDLREGQYGVGSLAYLNAVSRMVSDRVRASVADLTGVASFGIVTTVASLFVAPIAVQIASDGSSPWLRGIIVAASLVLIAGIYAFSHGISEPAPEPLEPDLGDETIKRHRF